MTSRASIGCVRNDATPAVRARADALDEVDEQAERARARADHDRRAQRERVGNAPEQDALHLLAAGQVARDRSRRGRGSVGAPAGSGRRGTRFGARRRARPQSAKFSAPRRARARRTARRRRCAPSSGSGSRRPRPVERASQPGAAEHVAAYHLDVAAPAMPDVGRRACERSADTARRVAPSARTRARRRSSRGSAASRRSRWRR